MALTDHTEVKGLAAELLKTSQISNDTINNIYVPKMTNEVLDRVGIIYSIPFAVGGVPLPDSDPRYPAQVKDAVLYKVTALAIVNNYADKANNQEALGVAKYYEAKADTILENIAPKNPNISPRLIFSFLDQRSLAETEFSFITDEGDCIDDRAEKFLNTLDKRFY